MWGEGGKSGKSKTRGGMARARLCPRPGFLGKLYRGGIIGTNYLTGTEIEDFSVLRKLLKGLIQGDGEEKSSAGSGEALRGRSS